jgi:glycosyltransferase involved in cell wall biosynthesis
MNPLPPAVPDHRAGPDDWTVPDHRALVFRPRRSEYAVCVFVLNEGERVRRQLARMRPWLDRFDLIVADGGSTDGATAPEAVAAAGAAALLVKTGPGRLSAQMRMALAFTLRRGYAGTVVMDGNDKDDPAALPRFAAALAAGYDHVQGSRFVTGGRAVNTPLSRLLAIRLLHSPLLSLAAGFRYTDTTNGFRAYGRQLLLDPLVRPFRPVFSGYELHYYLAVRAARLGYGVCEVPVTRAYPASGPVPTKIHGWRGNWGVLKTLAAACAGRWDPPAPAPRRAA